MGNARTMDLSHCPGSFIALAVHFLIHGFFLDVIIIGFLPFISSAAGDASRKKLFPWCLGGYSGFGADEVPNLAPTHRRFIAENAAYAILRGGAGVYILCGGGEATLAALVLAVVSHWAEAATIAWELSSFGAPPDSAPPMTLMGIFSTWTMITVLYNQDDYLGTGMELGNQSVNAIVAFATLTWTPWLSGVIGVCKNKAKNTGTPDEEQPLQGATQSK